MAKNILGSVGQGGSNGSQSVMTIQYLLNCVPAVQGGPATELVVDGLIGPKTVAAILNFQKAHFSTADGRVDPNGSTLKALQQFDPFPQISYVVAGQKTTGLKLGGLPGEKFGPNTGVKSAGL
ncbi:MAG TPA: peptidoglycan-binding protein, partial [Planctomycetota bacterium]|nr:peptidoglycan-binding protein [Planctomycetota bacterium]